MRVVTAPEKYDIKLSDFTIFLAGGITSCPDWQNDVIEYLEKQPDTEHLVIFNPRRPDWPDGSDYAEMEKQIAWEKEWLDRCDLFTIYFASSTSPQPISFYELGRQLALRNIDPWGIVISCGPDFSRINDVDIQSYLALGLDLVTWDALPEDHAYNIYKQYQTCKWRDFEPSARRTRCREGYATYFRKE